ncbi:hypothetical protein [Yinghuangia seranimata]|uniref:hypothetical protein n=1 Tax=Yinghuangia seranimata TaxID=408067 RepID=UPI00248D0D23|nr:hypothetical protein [Yinghuangia seranimata]MDI2125836.1 hypothetical protein [Yinghuangia seranimata]
MSRQNSAENGIADHGRGHHGAAERRGFVLLVAGVGHGRRKSRLLEDSEAALAGWVGLPPQILVPDAPADVVQLPAGSGPQTVRGYLERASVTRGPVLVFLTGHLMPDRRGELHVTLRDSTSNSVRYDGLPWAWLAETLRIRDPRETLVIADLTASEELRGQVYASPGVLADRLPLWGVLTPSPTHHEPAHAFTRTLTVAARRGFIGCPALVDAATMHPEVFSRAQLPAATVQIVPPPGTALALVNRLPAEDTTQYVVSLTPTGTPTAARPANGGGPAAWPQPQAQMTVTQPAPTVRRSDEAAATRQAETTGPDAAETMPTGPAYALPMWRHPQPADDTRESAEPSAEPAWTQAAASPAEPAPSTQPRQPEFPSPAAADLEDDPLWDEATTEVLPVVQPEETAAQAHGIHAPAPDSGSSDGRGVGKWVPSARSSADAGSAADHVGAPSSAAAPRSESPDRSATHAAAAGPYLYRQRVHELRGLVSGGQHDVALDLVRELAHDMEARYGLGPEHRDTLDALETWAWLAARADHVGEAVEVYTETARRSARIHGPGHATTRAAADAAYTLWLRVSDLEEARASGPAVVALRELVLGPNARARESAAEHLATLAAPVAEPAAATPSREARAPDTTPEAEPEATTAPGPDPAPDAREETFPPPPELREALADIAAIAADGRYAEAFGAADAVIDALTADVGRDHPHTLNVREIRAYLTAEAGDVADAVEAYLGIAKARLAAGGSDHPDTVAAVDNAHALWLRLADPEDAAAAEASGRRLVALREHVPGPGGRGLAGAKARMAALEPALSESEADHAPEPKPERASEAGFEPAVADAESEPEREPEPESGPGPEAESEAATEPAPESTAPEPASATDPDPEPAVLAPEPDPEPEPDPNPEPEPEPTTDHAPAPVAPEPEPATTPASEHPEPDAPHEDPAPEPPVAPPPAEVRAYLAAIKEATAHENHIEALTLAEELTRGVEARHGPAHPYTLNAYEVRAHLTAAAGLFATAAREYAALAQRVAAAVDPDAPGARSAADAAQSLWLRLGRTDAARTLGPGIVDLRRIVPGPDGAALDAARDHLSVLISGD